MRTAVIKDRIADQCPAFAFVGHALTAPTTVRQPAALISPIKSIASATEVLGGTFQRVTTIYGVYLVLRRRADGDADAGAADELDDLRGALWAALVGFADDPEDAPLAIAGGQMDQYAPGLVTWREDFMTYRYERVIP
jgi:hypothetical protein